MEKAAKNIKELSHTQLPPTFATDQQAVQEVVPPMRGKERNVSLEAVFAVVKSDILEKIVG